MVIHVDPDGIFECLKVMYSENQDRMVGCKSMQIPSELLV